MPLNGVWTDLISEFLSYTEGEATPDLFRLWSGISLVAGALERRVWARVGDHTTFPNLFTLLVAPPGVGKQIVDQVGQLWTSTSEPGTLSSPAFHVAEDSLTKASLMDVLGESKRSFLPPKGAIETYHSLLIAAEEFGVLLPAYDQEFIANLNRLFGNPASYKERRRASVIRKLVIEKPQINLLAGVTPAYFTGTFPEEAWTTGFARRVIMVYSSETPFKELFQASSRSDASRAHLLQRLSQLAGLYGQISWRTSAVERLAGWHRAGGGKGGPPVPTHSKLEHYNRSRTMHAIKLSMISAVSRTGSLIIEESDVDRAIDWLVEAEGLMPDIFRAMIGRSDVQVIEELHYYVTAEWARGGKKAVPGEKLRRFLLTRMPSDKVRGVLEGVDSAAIISRIAGTDDWIPRPKSEYEME